MTLLKPPRRIVVKLGNGVELIEFVPPGRFGPRIVNEGPSRPQRREAPDPPFRNDEA
ncbi:MAG TPA: hypothetical protein VGQ48_00330 [Gemmatimonadales bacterium]|nr:hypothetical protein [Gemmatimonadales bacterium]